MAPTKKREKDATPVANGSNCSSNGACMANLNGNSSTNNNADVAKINGHQQEQELFLQAFEKPTQIYRFLRNRHGTSPIFLNRTLSYMKDRMSRNNKKRATFKVSSLLQTIFEKNEPSTNKFLNIVFNGLFKNNSTDNYQCWNDGDAVCVESILFKITKSKRKDSTSDFQEILKHRSNIVFNPHDNIGQYAAISIPLLAMKPLGDQHIIFKLLFRIKTIPRASTQREDVENNGENSAKRLKMCNKIYGCQINIFERNVGAIPEGDYEVAMREVNPAHNKSFSPKKLSWETLPQDNAALSVKFDALKVFPKLKFRLTWSKCEITSIVNDKDFFKSGGTMNTGGDGTTIENQSNGNNRNGNNEQINHNNNCIKSGIHNVQHAKREKIQIIYNFLYSNNTRQQTEYTQEVICPWCSLDCLRLYALLKHLKLCHARFNFTYQPAGNSARIDVTINDSYDGSYAGSPYDLAGPAGCSFARTCGPVRRTSVTNLLVCRPRRLKTGLDEFLVLDEDDLSNQRPYITGHNRLYHHTETCLPVHPKELGIDSEGESDPLWLRQKTIQMIDEFSDVNEGEKELMKLWNLHVMKHGYVGDCQLPLACEMFLDANGHEIIRKNLYRNFMLHLSSLFDYGLISPETLYKTVQKLHAILSKYTEGQEMMTMQHDAQLKYWHDIGRHKQVEQKLKMPPKHTNNCIENDNQSDTGSDTHFISDIHLLHPSPKRMTAAVKHAVLPASTSTSNSAESAVKLLKNQTNKSAGRKETSPDDNNELSLQSKGDRRSSHNVKKDSTIENNINNSDKNLVRKTAKKSAFGDQTTQSHNKRTESSGSRRNSNTNDTLPNAVSDSGKLRLLTTRSLDSSSLKRKLSSREVSHQSNAKRIRPNSSSKSSVSRLSSTSMTRSSSHKQDPTSTAATRRRSVPIRKTNTAIVDHGIKSPGKNGLKSGLRTRVSLPLTKSDKR